MKPLSKNALIGYPAGIITGISYGLNPLFGMPLMSKGAEVESILFFRYGIAVVILGAVLLCDKQSFKITWRQAGILLILGLLYTASSVTLFEAYKYIPSGLATTRSEEHT
jgi:drug/metabolite transporter (DMT)-like permease